MSPVNATPTSATSNTSGLFFPPSQPTPDHLMLAARKQQLAHLQNLQRQQQQMLQQMTPRSHSMSPMPSMSAGGYEERNDRFTSGGMRSPAVSYKSSVGTPHSARFSTVSSSSQPVFECDYDTNPTELYLAVQKKDWEAAASIAAEFPHEASTWVSRKESDGKLRWRLLPLHAAIIFKAPEKAVGALLCAFSHGAACKDDQGMLPLHLAFRNGCDEQVVNLLLMAYPQSVDVQDRKGRTPMVLAQGSNHPNRDAYIRALERGAAYYAVAGAAKDGAAESAPSSNVMSEEERNNLEALRMKVDQLTVEHAERVTELEAELNKTQETSQVLVDHVNSLEAQLASRSDTERFLATKIANLDSQLKAATKTLEEKEAEYATTETETEEKINELLARVEAAEAEAAEYKLALDDKREAAKKVYAMTNKERLGYEERMEKCEREAGVHRANAEMLEEQLKKKIETEHALASQVSMLAAQLASSASNTTEATNSYQRKCETLQEENESLKKHVATLEKKLSTVASALDAMATEQELIVAAASRHEQTMADAAAAHLRIMNDTARQESLLEDAAKEREQIVAILMRQAEDAERTMSDRERILEAVREQEEGMMAAAEERDLVVASVNKQREYMDFVMNGELKFLKMTKSEEEQEDEVENRRMEMEARKEEYFASTFDKDEEEECAFDKDGEEECEQIESEEETATALPSQREAELRAQIAIEEAMLAKLKADEAEAECAEQVNDAEIALEEAMLAKLKVDEVETEEGEPTEDVAADASAVAEEEELSTEEVAVVEDSEEPASATSEKDAEEESTTEAVAPSTEEVAITETAEEPKSIDPEPSSSSEEKWIPLKEETVEKKESNIGEISAIDTNDEVQSVVKSTVSEAGDAQSVSSRKSIDP